MQGRYRGDMGARLHGGAVRDRLVRVDAAAERLAVEEVGEQLADLGDARGAAHEHHLVHLALLEPRVLEHALDRVEAALEGRRVERLELGAREGHLEVDAVREGLHLELGLRRGGSNRAQGSTPREE